MSFWKRLFGGGSDTPTAQQPPRRRVEERLPVDPDADYLLSLLQQSARSPHSDVASRVGDVAFFAAVNRIVQRGDERLAADLLGRFVMLRPDHTQLVDRLAALLESNADLDGAERFYQKLATMPATECRARVRLADIHQRRGDVHAARRELELVLVRDVRFPGARERLATLQAKQVDALATVAGPGEAMAIGRYRLRGELGRGGSGIVYRAFDPSLEREVAVKMLYQSHKATEEVELVARLRHPGLIAIYDFDLPTGVLVMELCRGGSLRTAKRDPTEHAAILIALAEVLSFLHGANIVHGDLTPDNVLFRDASHQPVLTDFGLARRTEEPSSGDDTQRQLLGGGGTVGFVAPEVVSRRELGPPADVYSFGALLAWLRPELAHEAEVVAALQADEPAARPATSELPALVKRLFRS